MSSTLYLIGTPIGNLKDMSPRAAETLALCDVVLAEDTRVTAKLMHHLGLFKKLLSCHDHNEGGRLSELAEWSNQGLVIGLVSDAGMPLVSDPGYRIVAEAVRIGMKVVPVPGASSVLAALVGSGLPCERFCFEGFLPDKQGERRKRLSRLADYDQALVFFVSVKDLPAVLSDLREILKERRACIARELTKKFEEFIRGNLSELAVIVAGRELKGEVVLVVEGSSGKSRMSEEAVLEKMQTMLAGGGRLREVASLLAPESGWTSSELYKLGLRSKEHN